MNPDISVIVPVYNAEKYLAECLESIMCQTKRELEFILVDDGSTDGSGKLCDFYAEKDSRIRVLHSENHGLIATRKKGLSVSRGKYVGYVDSDDWIEPEMYERMYRMIGDNGCDMVTTGLYRQFDDRKLAVTNTIMPGVYDRVRMEAEILPKMLFNGVYFQMGVRPNLVNKLFKRELLLGEQMDVPEEITNGEDTAVTYSCMMRSGKVCLSNDIFYHYRQHGASMSKAQAGERDIESIKALYAHLTKKLCFGKYDGMMRPQVNTYISNMLVQRCFQAYDREGELFSAFGGIGPGKRAAVYGAGNFGRQIHDYALAKSVDTIWVDEKYDFYQAQGLDVRPVEELSGAGVEEIFIAIIDEEVAGRVRNRLIADGVEKDRIRWLDIEYISSVEALRGIGIKA